MATTQVSLISCEASNVSGTSMPVPRSAMLIAALSQYG